MTFVQEALRDRPLGLWPLDTSPYKDYSGYGRDGVLTGVPSYHAGLAKGLLASPILGDGKRVAINSPVFFQGEEGQSFSLEAFVNMLGVDTSQNLIRNPVPASTTDWSMSNPGVGGASSLTFDSATRTVVATVTTAPTDTQYTMRYGPAGMPFSRTPVVAGKRYYQSVVLNSSVADVRRMAIDWFNDAGTAVGSSNVGPFTLPANTNVLMSMSAVAPAGATTASVLIVYNAGAGSGSVIRPVGSTMRMSSGIFTAVGSDHPVPYFDGSMVGYEWMGTPNASYSRKSTTVGLTNLIRNPSFEQNLDGTNAGGGASTTRVQDADGSYFARGTVTSLGSTPYMYVTNGFTAADSINMRPVLTAGREYSFGVRVRVNFTDKTKNFSGQIRPRDYAGTAINTGTVQLSSIPLSNTGWQYLRAEGFTLPPGTRTAAIILYSLDGAAVTVGDIIDIDNAILVEGPHLPEYFDGDSDNVYWAGTPHASESFLAISDTENQVVGNIGHMDGITLKGTKVAFTTKYLSSPDARVEYDLQQPQRTHIVGVHTRDKNSLYVNGRMVAETTLTLQQQADKFRSTTGTLYIGGTGRMAVGGVAVYGAALPRESVANHYVASLSVPNSLEVVSANVGDHIRPSLDSANLFLDQWWSTAQDWSLAELHNTAVVDDRLVPQFTGDSSIAGYWLDTFALSAADTSSIYGVLFNWDGEGAQIDVSLDGITWETVQRGVKISMVPSGFNPSGKVLIVRASFPGGIVQDTSYLDNLNAVGLRSDTTAPIAGRTITYAAATPERDYRPLEFHSNWGVEIASGGSIVISADSSTPSLPVRTLEAWIKPGDGTTVSVSGTTYVNGAVGMMPNNEWVLLHIVAASNITGAITITGPAQVGHVGLYESALTATQIAEIYSEYTGTKTLKVGDNSVINMTESAQAVKIYAHDWTILASG